MVEMKTVDHLSFTECTLQFAHKMAWQHEDNFSLTGDVMDEAKMADIAQTNNDIILTAFIAYYKMMLNIYFGRPVEAAEHGVTNMEFGFSFAHGTHMVPRNTFFIGLSMILAYKLDGNAKRLRTAKKMNKRLKDWVKKSNPNVLHFLHLLQAELNTIQRKFAAAVEEYVAAIKAAMRTGYKLDYALSNELLALFYANPEQNPLHDDMQAKFYMDRALDAYQSYGALSKVNDMKRRYPHLLAIETA